MSKEYLSQFSLPEKYTNFSLHPKYFPKMTPKLFVIDSANLETTNVSVEAILSRLNLSDYQLVRFFVIIY